MNDERALRARLYELIAQADPESEVSTDWPLYAEYVEIMAKLGIPLDSPEEELLWATTP